MLRPWAEPDAAGLVTAYADPDVQRWHCRSLDLEEAAALILRWRAAWPAEAGASWAVVDGEDRLLGRAALRDMHLADGVAEIAYWVLPAARRRGVATAAVAVLTRWAFEEVGLQRLEIFHSVANTASCAVATSTGFRPEGTLRASVLHADGWHDMHLHARLRSDPTPA